MRARSYRGRRRPRRARLSRLQGLRANRVRASVSAFARYESGHVGAVCTFVCGTGPPRSTAGANRWGGARDSSALRRAASPVTVSASRPALVPRRASASPRPAPWDHPRRADSRLVILRLQPVAMIATAATKETTALRPCFDIFPARPRAALVRGLHDRGRTTDCRRSRDQTCAPLPATRATQWARDVLCLETEGRLGYSWVSVRCASNASMRSSRSPRSPRLTVGVVSAFGCEPRRRAA